MVPKKILSRWAPKCYVNLRFQLSMDSSQDRWGP